MGLLSQDFRFTLRQLVKKPSFTVAALLILTLGIGSNAALFGFVHTLLWKPFPFEDPDRLVRLYAAEEGRGVFYGNFSYPEFVDVLIPLGNAYTRRGFHEKGLDIDLRLTQLRADDPMTWYNLACSYSLLKRVEQSVSALRRSIELGYIDFDDLRKDPDLFHLRQSPRYRELIESLSHRHARHSST